MLNFLTHAPVDPSAATETAQLVFDPIQFINNLQYMGIGMLVIFLVIGVIILATMLVNYLFSDPNA